MVLNEARRSGFVECIQLMERENYVIDPNSQIVGHSQEVQRGKLDGAVDQ